MLPSKIFLSVVASVIFGMVLRMYYVLNDYSLSFVAIIISMMVFTAMAGCLALFFKWIDGYRGGAGHYGDDAQSPPHMNQSEGNEFDWLVPGTADYLVFHGAYQNSYGTTDQN